MEVHRPRGRCPACGYDLAGLVTRGTPRCPECGLTLDEALWREIRRRDRRRAAWSLGLAFGGPLVFDLAAAASASTLALVSLAPILVLLGGAASCAGFYGTFRLLSAERPFLRLDWVILIGALVEGAVVAVAMGATLVLAGSVIWR